MPKRSQIWAWRWTLVLVASALVASGGQRFPKPDFRSGYTVPQYTPPAVQRTATREWLDVGLLAGGLVLAGYFALARRSRRGLWILSVASLVWFGLVRKGCVCPVGSIQNVVLGLVSPADGIPWTVAGIFLLPLVVALVAGRVFCAGVCPLGAIQDLVIFGWRPLPLWLRQFLGMIPPTYLAFAVANVAVGAGFWICRYDPFVGLFRRSGPAGLIALGWVLLLIGTVVPRPYCRFLCPYGVLLGWCSQLSRRHLTISPDQCIQCQLCEESCPFDAIRVPTPPHPDRAAARRRMVYALVLAPVWVGLGAVAGWAAADPLAAKVHPDCALAAELRAEESTGKKEQSWETRVFRASGRPLEQAEVADRDARRRLRRAWAWAGAFVGAVFAVRCIVLGRRSDLADYVPDRGQCLSCGRCFVYCPREHVRLGELDGIRGQP